MNKLLTLISLLFLGHLNLSAQHTQIFEILPKDTIIANSLYHKLSFLDSRTDTTHLGMVQTGAFNKRAQVVAQPSLNEQLHKSFNSLVDKNAGEQKLILQLRQFLFAEITTSMGEKGYCYLQGELYANNNGQYYKINSIDTVILVKSMDVTKALLRKGGETLISFITDNLPKEPGTNMVYSYNDIVHIDSLEKQKIKLYTTSNYTDGMYLTYQSFKDQVPDKAITVETNIVNFNTVKYLNENGKLKRLKTSDVYAIVHQGQPYIATKYNFYPLKKVNNDFIFTGQVATTANAGDVMVASAFFGVLGGLIASNAVTTAEMKIDHLNGGLIRLLEY